MKKFLCLILCLVLCLVMVFSSTACSSSEQEGSVLMAQSSATVNTEENTDSVFYDM